MLAALAYWAERNAASESTEHKRQVAAICRRIRFPDILASALLMYHSRFKCLQLYDPNRNLLLRAVSGCCSHSRCSCAASFFEGQPVSWDSPDWFVLLAGVVMR